MLRAAAYMLFASASFTVMAASAKVASAEVSSWVVVLARSLIIVGVTAPLVWARGVATPWSHPLLWVRAGTGFTAMLSYFWAIGHGPLAEVVSLQYTSPLFVAALSPLVLKEAVSLRTWALLAVGFFGAVVLLRPGLDWRPELIAALVSALFAAFAYLAVRKLTAEVDADVIVLHFAIFASVCSLPALSLVEGVPSGGSLLALAGVGFGALGGQMGITRAYGHGEAAKVAGLGYIAIPMAIVAGTAGFGEGFDAIAVAGTTLILIGGVGLASARAVTR